MFIFLSFSHLWVTLNSFNEILALVFVFHSMFDVGRSMFDVHLFHSPSQAKTTYPYGGLFSTPVRKLAIYRYFFPIACEICPPTNQATVMTR